MELIQNIAIFVGAVLSIISLATVLIKIEKNAVRKMFDNNTKELQRVNETQTEQLQKMQHLIEKVEANDTAAQENFGEKLAVVQEFCKLTCRQFIKDTYYKYKSTKKIPLYERKVVDSIYELYHDSLKSNSYITLLYNEIIEWDFDDQYEPHERNED